MDKIVSSKKSFDEIQQMVSLARQCMSSEINIKQYQTKQKLCTLLDYFNLSAYVLTKHEMFMGKNNNIQNIIKIIFLLVLHYQLVLISVIVVFFKVIAEVNVEYCCAILFEPVGKVKIAL